MIYKCRNCAGNVVYSPETKKMYCPYCDSEDSQEIDTSSSGDMTICPSCGGVVPLTEHTAATQCPYCNNYIIFEERVSGEYFPKMLVPFKLGKENCKKAIRDKFCKKVFAPTDFLSEVRLNSMQGTYVPFWFYDYDVNAEYQAEATKVRKWTTGDMHYTETSYYSVRRNADIHFRDIPVDASIEMPNEVMDLLEPFDYKQNVEFDPKYLSGFYAEKYNLSAEDMEDRARKKMQDDTAKLMMNQVTGYSSVRPLKNDVNVSREEQQYGMLPVWKYLYNYKGQTYPFYVNGQSGKIVGEVPISTPKVWIYAGTLGVSLFTILSCAAVWLSWI